MIKSAFVWQHTQKSWQPFHRCCFAQIWMQVCFALWFVLGTQYLKTTGGSYNSGIFTSDSNCYVMSSVTLVVSYVVFYVSFPFSHIVVCLWSLWFQSDSHRSEANILQFLWIPFTQLSFTKVSMHFLCNALNRLKQVQVKIVYFSLLPAGCVFVRIIWISLSLSLSCARTCVRVRMCVCFPLTGIATTTKVVLCALEEIYMSEDGCDSWVQ